MAIRIDLQRGAGLAKQWDRPRRLVYALGITLLTLIHAYWVAKLPKARTASVRHRLFRAMVPLFQREIRFRFAVQVLRLDFAAPV
jgi:hypothetical protein